MDAWNSWTALGTYLPKYIKPPAWNHLHSLYTPGQLVCPQPGRSTIAFYSYLYSYSPEVLEVEILTYLSTYLGYGLFYLKCIGRSPGPPVSVKYLGNTNKNHVQGRNCTSLKNNTYREGAVFLGVSFLLSQITRPPTCTYKQDNSMILIYIKYPSHLPRRPRVSFFAHAYI